MKRTLVPLLPALFLMALTPASLFGQVRLASRFGEAHVGAQRVIVHVTVAVPPGWDANAVTEEALLAQGARPFAPAEFTLTGLLWDQFFNAEADQVDQYYNPAGEPTAAAAILQITEGTWTGVSTSRFTFQYGGTTGRCPSLVKECPGAQVFDGFNDVGWLSLSGCCTLAVTWYGTSIDEADMALNTRFTWTTNGNDYDIQTVMLHENGHVVGLGHSSVSGSIMQAVYAGSQHTLGQDDIRGATYLYPTSGSVGDISGTVTDSGGAPIARARVNIADFPVSATTDASGNYILAGVPDIGTYSVTASKGGYQSQTINGVNVPNTSLNFQLTKGH